MSAFKTRDGSDYTPLYLTDINGETCIGCLSLRMKSIGRELSFLRGDAPRLTPTRDDAADLRIRVVDQLRQKECRQLLRHDFAHFGISYFIQTV